MADAVLAFGPFAFDVTRGALLRDGVPVPIGQRAFAVLLALAQSPGRTVPKEELLACAWPGTIVEEGNLTVQIANLRKALGASGEWILTVPRVGYKLMAPSPDPAPARQLGPPSIAVMPFDGGEGAAGQGALADGIVADVIAALGRFRTFTVAARGSTIPYQGRSIGAQQAARELSVRYLIEGRVRRVGDRLRASVQLIDGDCGDYLWIEQFDGSAHDPLELQDRVAATVAMRVERYVHEAENTRSRSERPGSTAAYDVNLHAFTWTKTAEENAAAYAELVEALTREPENPRLLAHAAGTIEQRIAMGWPPFGPDDRQRCRELARRGLLKAEGDAKVMADCGMSLLQGAREYDWGLAVLESAVALNPNDERVVVRAGVAHLHCGDLEQALAHFHRARALSPGNYGSAAALSGIAHVHIILGNHAEARDWAMRSLAVNPIYDPTYWMLVAANAHLGRLDEARRYLAEFRRLMPEVTLSGIRAGQPARDPRRIAPILLGLRLAGLPEGVEEPMIPCLAVLPFADLGGEGQSWFGEGVVDDIITALTRFRSFTVVARISSFAYRAAVNDPTRVARELGVRYLLDGSVRRSGDRLRISARLVFGESAAQLWAESFDGTVADVFDFQDRITEAVALVVEPRIQAAEIERSHRERPGSAASYDVYLRALAGISSETAAGNAEAYKLLLEGLERDPDHPQLLALAAWALEHRCTMAWPPFGPDDRERCADFARRALERAGGDAMILAHCGMSLLQGAREYDWGMAVLEEAVTANPNNPMVLVRAAVGHMHCGDLEQTLTLVRRADRLSPGDPGAHFSLSVQADVALIRGEYAAALDLAGRAYARNPNFDPTLWLLIAANAHLGQLAEAKRYLERLRAIVPDATVARIEAGQPDRDPSRKAALLDGLRLAGLPER